MIPQYNPVVFENEKIVDSVTSQINNREFGVRRAVDSFEELLREETKARYVHSTTSGTAALILAIKALNLPRNSTILFPAYTFLAGASAARFLGYKIRLVDIRMLTLCLNPDQLEASYDQNVSAVIFVNHNAYNGVDILRTKQWCGLKKIPMIEDSAQCLGTPHTGKTGDIGIFSFSVPKIVTTGQGGAVFTNNKIYSERIVQARNHGDPEGIPRIHNHLGINLRFNDILASVGIPQLKNLKQRLSERERVLDLYSDRIPIYRNAYNDSEAWMAIYRTQSAKQLELHLKDRGIEAKRFYNAIARNPPFNLAPVKIFTEAEIASRELLYLPSSLDLSEKDINYICEEIMKWESVH